MKKDTKDINNSILFIVIGTFILVQRSLPENIVSNPLLLFVISYLSSIGFYNILVAVLYWSVNNFDILLKYYYNKIFLKGIWSYKYTLNGKIFFGIWEIEQDLHGILVTGYGLNINGSARSDVRSVSQLIYNKGAYDIVNTRIDAIEQSMENFSKTTLHPIIDKKKFFRVTYPKKIRATTYIYGGKLSGNIHSHVLFEKHENSTPEEVKDNLLQFIKTNFEPALYEY